MLNLNANPQVWVHHEETDTEYLIQPLDPRRNQKLLKEARDPKKGDVDFIKHNGLIVNEVVLEWKRVGGPEGELPPTDENKRKLGEKFPPVAQFLFQQATDIKLFVDEVDAAKNA